MSAPISCVHFLRSKTMSEVHPTSSVERAKEFLKAYRETIVLGPDGRLPDSTQEQRDKYSSFFDRFNKELSSGLFDGKPLVWGDTQAEHNKRTLAFYVVAYFTYVEQQKIASRPPIRLTLKTPPPKEDSPRKRRVSEGDDLCDMA